ncbi:MAG: TolC family protein [Chitinivibrionia bacterium]|nr:TolC family protein [Chitinivibrionia bacterium]
MRKSFQASAGPLTAALILLCAQAPARSNAPDEALASEDTLYLSLSQAVRLALQHNEDVKIAESDLDKAYGRKKEAYSAALPNIAGQAGYTRNVLRPVIFFPNPENDDEVLKIEIGEKNDFVMSVSARQPLYAFGRIGGAIKIADYYLKSSEKDLNAAQQQVVLDIKEAYYRVLLADAAFAISAQALDQTRRHLDETIVKLDQRVAARFDSIRAAVAVKNAEPAVIESENARVLSMLDLKRIAGIDRSAPVKLTDRLEFAPGEYDLESAIDRALANRPDVAAMRLRVAMTEKIVSVTKRNNFPFLSAVGAYTLQGQESDSFFPSRDKFAQSFGVGLVLSVPLFDGFSTRGKVQQAKADFGIMRYSLQKIEKAVELQVTQLYSELVADMDNLKGQEATVALAEEAYRLGLVRYQNGLSTSLELSDTEFALTSARLNHLRAVYNCIITAERLENAMGD